MIMTPTFNLMIIDQLAKQSREPAWLTELRRQALTTHARLPWPHVSDDIWRRTNVSLLDPMRGFAMAQPALHQSIALSESQVHQLTRPLGDEQLFVRANGAWLAHESSSGPVSPSAADGLVIDELAKMAHTQAREPIRRLLEANGLTDAEQKLSSLNAAFHHDDLYMQVPAHYAGHPPIRVTRLFSASNKQAIFPMSLITVGAGSEVTIIDEYISTAGPSAREGDAAEPSLLVNGRIELVLEQGASVRYVRLQRWDTRAREFLLQRATLAAGSTLTMVNVNLGAALSKAHVITKLAGEGASTKLYGFVFGHGTQHIDQHTLQDHQAPHTESDLQFKAALQDQSRMIYTGLIRIAPAAKQTNAYQSNHNLLLSRTAKAETIPMLEILADDVQCKHGASIGPIDDEQTFYLRSRGIPHETAQRLIVMGFIEPIIQQIPFEPLQEQLRQEIEGSLHSDGSDATPSTPVSHG